MISGHQRTQSAVGFHPPKSMHERREKDGDHNNPEQRVGGAKFDIRPLPRELSNRERHQGAAEALGGDMHGRKGLLAVLGLATSLLPISHKRSQFHKRGIFHVPKLRGDGGAKD